MKSAHAQGRLKVMSVKDAMLEWIFSWPQAFNLEKDDANLILDFAMTWHFINKQKATSPLNLDLNSVELLFDAWLAIPANFLLDKDVLAQSVRLLSSLIGQIWIEHLDIRKLRKFKAVFAKAAADIESKIIAGCLKLSIIKLSVLPEIFTFGNETRKIASKHFSCTVMILFRSQATSEDIENYYIMKNQAETQVKTLQ